MFKSFSDAVESKTFWGILLGVVGIILGALEGATFLPEVAVRIIQVVGFLIATMGVRDRMLESQASLITKIVDLHSKTFWGVFIAGLIYVIDNPDIFPIPIPPEYSGIVQALGAIVGFIGLRDAAARSTAKG